MMQLHPDKGFTLMEILTAMMLLAICLTTILQLFSEGLKAVRLSGDYTRAIFHAREKMDEIMLAERLTDADLEGEFPDGSKWSAVIRYVEPDEENIRRPLDLFHITVKVMWPEAGGTKNFEINAIHIAKKIE
jgi:general secretion pathway protein I